MQKRHYFYQTDKILFDAAASFKYMKLLCIQACVLVLIKLLFIMTKLIKRDISAFNVG